MKKLFSTFAMVLALSACGSTQNPNVNPQPPGPVAGDVLKVVNDAINSAAYVKQLANLVFIEVSPLLNQQDLAKYQNDFNIAMAALDAAVSAAKAAVAVATSTTTASDFDNVVAQIVSAAQQIKALLAEIEGVTTSSMHARKMSGPSRPVGLDDLNRAVDRMKELK